jgi:hypothetical protein
MMNRESTQTCRACRTIRHRECIRCIENIMMENKEERCCCCYQGLRCEKGGELSNRKEQKGNGALKRHGPESIKWKINIKRRGV